MFTANEKDSVLTISFTGHFGIFEAESFSPILDKIDSTIKSVVFDMKNVDYISSSGLRILLRIRKKFLDNDCVNIINCNETIYNTICTTGFQYMMKVSKKVKSFDINKSSWKDILSYRAKNMPDYVFIKYGGKEYTWKDIDIYSQIIANDLALMGVKTLSHVGIIGTNSINYICTFFAIQKLGAIAVLINDKLKTNEVISHCEIGDVAFLCVGNYFDLSTSEKLKSEVLEKACISNVYNISDSIILSNRVSEYSNIKHLYKDSIMSDSPSLMIFSSGSTGKAKAVLLSTYNLIYKSLYQINRWKITHSDTVCLSSPLFHIFGLKVGFVYSVILNNKICITKDNRTATIIDTINQEKCTLIPLVPTMLLALIRSRSFDNEKLKSLRMLIFAGSKISKPQLMRAFKMLPNVNFINLYGLSELTPLSATIYNDTVQHISETVGIPSKDVQVKIIDSLTKKECKKLEEGEIFVQGTNSFLCYYKCPIEDQSIDSDGFIHTGDIGFIDNDGYLHISGRIKDIIIRGGENILPSEIENAIASYENIKEVKVIGIPDEFYGEIIGACISLYDPSKWNEEELNNFLSTKIANFKIPAKYVLYEYLPILGNGKFDQKTMKKDLLQ